MSYIRGKWAHLAVDLLDRLRANGLDVGGVGYPDGRRKHLIVQLNDMSQASLVPETFQGERVVVEKGGEG
jgi:hypothetical protein